MNEALGVLATPDIGFLALAVIGGFAGWIVGVIAGAPRWPFTNILIGVAGSWLGSQLADMFGVAAPGSVGHFVAALVGALLIVSIWGTLYPETGRDRHPTI